MFALPASARDFRVDLALPRCDVISGYFDPSSLCWDDVPSVLGAKCELPDGQPASVSDLMRPRGFGDPEQVRTRRFFGYSHNQPISSSILHEAFNYLAISWPTIGIRRCRSLHRRVIRVLRRGLTSDTWQPFEHPALRINWLLDFDSARRLHDISLKYSFNAGQHRRATDFTYGVRIARSSTGDPEEWGSSSTASMTRWTYRFPTLSDATRAGIWTAPGYPAVPSATTGAASACRASRSRPASRCWDWASSPWWSDCAREGAARMHLA